MFYLESHASPAIAEKFTRELQSTLDQLKSMPHMGRAEHFDHPDLNGIRVWRIGGSFTDYLLFYRPIENGIELLHVLHGKRDIPTYFEFYAE